MHPTQKNDVDLYQSVFEHASDGIFVSDIQGNLIDVNLAGCNLLGYTREEILLKNMRDLVPRDELEIQRRRFEEMRAGKTILSERNVIRKNGAVIQVEINGRMLPDGRLMGVMREITARKEIEKVLRESEQHFRDIFERSPLGKALTLPDGRLLKVNSVFARMLGYSVEEMQGFNFAQLTSSEDLEKSQESVRCLLANEREIYQMEKRYIHKDGREIWANVSTTLMRSVSGDPLYFITSIEDITEKKKTQAEIQHLASFPQVNHNPVLETDARGEIIYANLAASRTLDNAGLPPDFRAFLPADFSQIVSTPTNGQETAFAREITLGEAIFREDIILLPQFQALRIYALDITGQKRAEMRLKKSNRIYALLSQVNQVIVRTRDIPLLLEKICQTAVVVGKFQMTWIGVVDDLSGSVRVAARSGGNDAYYALVEKIRGNENARNCAIQKVLQGQPYAICETCESKAAPAPCQKLAQELGCRSSAAFSLLISGKVRGSLNIYASEPEFFDEEEIKLLTELAMDISFAIEFHEKELEQIKAEETIRQKDDLLRQTGAMAHIGGWEFNAETLEGVWTDEVARIHDLDVDRQTNVKLGLSFYPEPSKTMITNAIQAAIASATPYDLELELISARGVHKWVRTVGAPVILAGKVVKIKGMIRDITDEKRSGTLLAEQNAKLSAILDNIETPIFSIDRQYRYTSFNRAHARMMKTLYNAEIEIGHPLSEYYTLPEDWQAARSNLDRALSGAVVLETAYSSHGTNHRNYFEMAHYPIHANQRDVIGVAVFVRDITEQRRWEEELMLSEERYRTVADYTHDMEYWRAPDGSLKYMSPSCERITGFRAEEYIQNPGLIVDIVHPLDKPAVITHRNHKIEREDGEQLYALEFRIICKDGEIRWISHICRPIWNENGKFLGIRATNRDITDRKESETQLDEQLSELRRWYSATLGREQRVLELKQEVNELLSNLGKPPRYPSVDTEMDDENKFQA